MCERCRQLGLSEAEKQRCGTEESSTLNNLLNDIEADLKKLLQDKTKAAELQAEAGVDNTTAKLKRSGIYHALGVVQSHRMKAGI